MRFLIADDHQLFLKGLQLLLEQEYKDLEVISACDYNEMFDIINKDKNFDLIITDLAMPGAKWSDAIEKIYKKTEGVPVIVISAIFEEKIIAETIELGVCGYIIKTTANSDIIDAINMVLEGGVSIPEGMLNKVNDDKLKMLSSNVLTPRQVDVIKLIAKGMANKNIAYELGLTEGSVKIYVTNILKNLNVNNRTAAVLEAKRQEII